MKKTIFILLFINSYLTADYTLKIINPIAGTTHVFCITDYYFTNENDTNKMWSYQCDDIQYRWTDLTTKNIIITDNDGNSLIYENNILVTDDIPNNTDNTTVDNVDNNSTSGSLSDYTLDETLPLTNSNLTALGLTDEDLNFNFAISGILMSFLFLYGIFTSI